MTIKRDISLAQGATYRRAVSYKNIKTGPIDLTGCTFRIDILPSVSPTPTKTVLNSEQGHVLVTNPKAGEFVIHLKPEVTALFTWTKARYQLSIIYPNGDVNRLMEGVINCSRMI